MDPTRPRSQPQSTVTRPQPPASPAGEHRDHNLAPIQPEERDLAAADDPLLQVRGLRVTFRTAEGTVAAVRGIDFTLAAGERLAMVGESGSGKSTAAWAVARLLPKAPLCQCAGTVALRGIALHTLPERKLRKIRGREIGMVFQDPSSSLNPVIPVGSQMREALRVHHPGLSRTQREQAVRHRFQEVGLPVEAFQALPSRLSGGQQQRVALALALAGDPRILIADEATSALDTTTQLRVLDRMDQLCRERAMALLLITHDLAIARGRSDRIVVLGDGVIVEQGPTSTVLTQPQHPYTAALLHCIPRLGQPRRRLPTLAAAMES